MSVKKAILFHVAVSDHCAMVVMSFRNRGLYWKYLKIKDLGRFEHQMKIVPGVGIIYSFPPKVVEFAQSVRFQDLLAGTRFPLVPSMLATIHTAVIDWGSSNIQNGICMYFGQTLCER